MQNLEHTYRIRFNRIILGGLVLLFFTLIAILLLGKLELLDNKFSIEDFENEKMGQAYFAERSGNNQAGIQLYKKVLKRIPEMEAELSFKIGKAEYNSGNYIEAMSYFDRSIQTNYPDTSEVYFNVALTAHKLKRFTMAEKYYLKTIAHPQYGKEAYFNLANFYFFEFNDEVKALKYYQKAVENESLEKAYSDMLFRELKVNTERKDSAFHHYLLSELKGNKNKDFSRFALTEFTRNNPEKVQAHIHNYIGVIQVNNNNKQAAISHFQQAMVIDPEFKDAHFNFNKRVSEIKNN